MFLLRRAISLYSPNFLARLLLDKSDDCACSVDQQGAKISVSAFADTEQ